MRISDWSSDVCSSDLTAADRRPSAGHHRHAAGLRLRVALPAAPAAVRPPSAVTAPAFGIAAQPALPRAGGGGAGAMSGATAGGLSVRRLTKHLRLGGNRNSVGEGPSVSGHVVFGGRGIIKKKNTKTDKYK